MYWFEKKESGPVQKPPFTWHLNISLSRPLGGAQRPSPRRPGQTGAKYSQDRLSKLRPWIGWPPWQRTEFQGQVFAKDLNRMQTPKENVHSLWNFITAAPLLLHADVLRLRKYNCTSILYVQWPPCPCVTLMSHIHWTATGIASISQTPLKPKLEAALQDEGYTPE